MIGFRNAICASLLLSFALPAWGEGDSNPRLLRSLTGRNEVVRNRALNAINPRNLRQNLGDLIKAVRTNVASTGPDDLARPSTVAMLHLIGRADDPEAEGVLIEMLDADHLGIAMVTADVLGKNKFYGAIEALKAQTKRADFQDNYGFRFSLVRSLAQMEHPDAVEFLSELDDQLDGQLRHEIKTLMADVTVNHFQGDEERFEAWKGKTKEGDGEKRESIFKEAAFEQPESLERIQFQPQQYYGIDIYAKRLMFIIDHSGSMREYWGGQTRLERAKHELIRAIRDLPDDAEFAIVFYHTNVREWREELVRATEDNKREAIQFVRRLGYGGKTNTYGALRRSLEFDDDLEAVFLLTDGRPTAGNIVAHSAIVTDVLHRNRFRHLNFNTIGIAVEGQTRNFLRKLAEESNGEFREAN